MKKRIQFLTGMMSFLLMGSMVAFGQVTVQEARYDSAGSYGSGWTNGLNEGSGFTAWDLTDNNNGTTKYAGYYIGTDPTQNGRDSVGSSNSNIFGMYANSDDGGAAYAVAKRNFADADGNARALAVGETFTLEFAFSWNGGKRGINLYSDDSWSTFLYNVEHAGSDALNSTGGQLLSNIHNQAVTLSYTWNGGSTNNLTITATHDGATNSITTTVAAAPKGFSLYTERTGKGDDAHYEPFFNNFRITPDYYSVQITGDAGWRMLSFPNSGGSVEDISDNTAIQGVSGGDNTDKTSNFMTYDNTGAFETPASVSTNLISGYGFITYFYNNTSGGSSELPITLDAVGAEPSSNVSVDLNVSTLENGSYYTMVGNPFASNFDLNSITATGGAIQNNIQFWDNSSSTYSTQNRTTPYIITPWQGFWVETTSSSVTAISLPISGKTSSSATGTFFSKENPNSGNLNFKLTSANTNDEAIRLSVRPNATTGYDLDDASKFVPLANEYATMAFIGQLNEENKLQSVYSLPSQLNETISIPMELTNVGITGEFTLSWEGIESLPKDWKLELFDYETGNSVVLNEVDTFSFEADQAVKAKTRTILSVSTTMDSNDESGSRFGLIITPGTPVSNEDELATVTEFELEQNYPNPFNPTTTIKYSVGEAGPVSLTVYNVMGQKVAELLNTTKTAGTYQVNWNATGQASGIYYYRLQSPGQVITRQMTLIK